MIPADYEPVEDRLRAFWEDFPTGRVATLLVAREAYGAIELESGDYVRGSSLNDVIIFRCELYRFPEDKHPAATGYAHQRILTEPPKSSTGKPIPTAPEWTSPYEVAETSAIGRALANLGYAAKGKRPSREEVNKAQASGSTSHAYGEGASGSEPEPGGAAERPVNPPGSSAAEAAESEGVGRATSSDEVQPTPSHRQCDHDWQPVLRADLAAKGWRACAKCGRTLNPGEAVA